MTKQQNTLDRQTAKFIATCAESLPNLPKETMQYWIENPKKLATRMSTLTTKKIVVIGNSLDFLTAFFETAGMFLGNENLGEDGDDYSAIHAEYGDTDRIVFINFSCCVLDGSDEAAEMYGGNTMPYIETYKFEMVISPPRTDEFELLIFDPCFLVEFERKNKAQFVYFMNLFEPKKVYGDTPWKQFIFKK
ncbi:MAG: hypothetical protein M1320_01580 [Patescibacteria group bacterium]|nr:hypothetical protein [Patescibacteria group bacterium]